ncbi:hypothetical protein K474DRAFT_1775618 [Panus rudis PR-1116 ss-1]|nr:hypothetical protein K474DRAFT_1775618 [Panus rudis PR-1116 ss-1]
MRKYLPSLLNIIQVTTLLISIHVGHVQATPTPTTLTTSYNHPRALDNILNTLDNNAKTQEEHKAEATAHTTQTTLPPGAHAQATASTSGLGILGHLTGETSQGGTKTSSGTEHLSGAKETPAGTYSLIGTIPPLPSYTPWSLRPTTSSSASSPTSSHADSEPSASITTAQASSGNSSSTREWKIIGVAVIAFTSVAAILLLAVFFDQWTKFIKDILWRRSNRDGKEELVPDWEKASWDLEYRLGKGRHRYPSFASLPSETLMLGLGFEHTDPSKTSQSLANMKSSNGLSEVNGNMCGVGTQRSASLRGRQKERDREVEVPLNNQPYRPPTMNAIANEYLSPRIPSASVTRSRSKSRSLRRPQTENPFEDPDARSPGLTSVYGGIAV